MKSFAPTQKTGTPARAAETKAPFFQQQSASAFFTPAIQTKLDVSQPGDPHELEAEQMADHVIDAVSDPFFTPAETTAPPPEAAPPTTRASSLSGSAPSVQSAEEAPAKEDEELTEPLQRENDPLLSAALMPSRLAGATRQRPSSSLFRAQSPVISSLGSTSVRPGSVARQPIRSVPYQARGPPPGEKSFTQQLHQSKGSGQPLPETTRSELEPVFDADFERVRIHTDDRAIQLANQAGAVAFAHEGDIYFNRGQFQPETPAGKHLLAHELTHVVQQGHAGPGTAPPSAPVHRRPTPTLARAPPAIQRFGRGRIRSRINSRAERITGYTLMTGLVGYNPILDQHIDWTASDFFRGAAGLIPFGTLIFDRLNEGGLIDSVFSWIISQINAYNIRLSRVTSLFGEAWDKMDFLRSDPVDYNVGVFRNTFSGFFSDLASFAGAVIDKLIDVLKGLAIKALRAVFGDQGPAYDLICQVLGEDPLTGETTAWSTENFLRSVLELFGFDEHLAKMEETGTLEKAAGWIDEQIGPLVGAFTGLITGIIGLWNSLSLETLVRPVQLLTNTFDLVTTFVDRLIRFAGHTAEVVLEFIKEVIIELLRPHVHSITGYTLFTVCLSQDPVTGEEVPRTAHNFVRGFLEFVPNGDEIYRNLIDGNAVGKAMEWLFEQVEGLGLSPPAIIERFVALWNSFSISDMMNPIGAFQRVGEEFIGFIGSVLTLTRRVAFRVLEILFETVMGAGGTQVIELIRTGQDTFRTIVEDPIGFVGNLIASIKQGFEQFGSNIWEHLKTGLFGWLFGALEGAGLQLPAQWDLKGILDLSLQVLGLTYEHIRPKLVDHLGETAVDHLETSFEFVRLIVTQGIGAAWEKILEFFTGNLLSIVIDGIKDWVVTRIITAAITRLATLFNPAGAILQAILAIYNTIMFFIERMQQILALAESVFSSVSKIASGAIGDAANYVEQTMTRTLPVMISFLARLIGLGGISEKIRDIITRVQAPVSRALDRVIGWVVQQARTLFEGVLQAGTGDMSPEEKLEAGMDAAVAAVNHFRGRTVGEAILNPLLEGIATRYSFSFLRVEAQGDIWMVVGKVNPESREPTEAKADEDAGANTGLDPIEENILEAIRNKHGMERVMLRELKPEITSAEVTREQLDRYIPILAEKGRLHYYQSNARDAYKMVTLDPEKGGTREIASSVSRRHLFGYNNPAHNSPTGRKVLASCIDWTNMTRTEGSVSKSTQLTWSFLNSARFVSWSTGTTNITRSNAVLGHAVSAGTHWNSGAPARSPSNRDGPGMRETAPANGPGMEQTRTQNQAWNYLASSYGGVEEKSESSSTGGSEARYLDPTPENGAKEWWYTPSHPDYPRISGYDFDYTGAR